MPKNTKKNARGVTKKYILSVLLDGWTNEIDLREKLIEEFPKVFSHKTKLATIRNYHLVGKNGLVDLGRVETKTVNGERYYKKIPEGIQEFEGDEEDQITLYE